MEILIFRGSEYSYNLLLRTFRIVYFGYTQFRKNLMFLRLVEISQVETGVRCTEVRKKVKLADQGQGCGLSLK